MISLRTIFLAGALALGGCTTTSEIHAKSTPLLTAMMKDVGRGRPKGCPARWCACYLDRKLASLGKAKHRTNLARAFASYGRPAKPGTVGSIMVMRSHVGVVIGRCKDGRVKLVSGNHSNRVGVGCYPRARAIAWRLP